MTRGAQHVGDPAANQAQADAQSAYAVLAGQACNTPLTGQDLGGKTLAPGVYCFTSSAQLTGQLVLDGRGKNKGVWVFQIASTLTTGTNASVVMRKGGRAGNVFWQVGSAATLGTGTAFAGNILAYSSITMNTAANLSGRALAREAVTMDSNNMRLP
jgi:type VI secretion system secreted protein VgrG